VCLSPSVTKKSVRIDSSDAYTPESPKSVYYSYKVLSTKRRFARCACKEDKILKFTRGA
jgi:hypothetical protein